MRPTMNKEIHTMNILIRHIFLHWINPLLFPEQVHNIGQCDNKYLGVFLIHFLTRHNKFCDKIVKAHYNFLDFFLFEHFFNF